MPTTTRRVRGSILRAARRRRVAVGIGLGLLAPAVGLMLADARWESWVTDGLGLLAGATGAALVVAGLSKRRPDWIDPEA